MKAVVVALVFALGAAAQEQTPQSTERSRVGTGVQDPVVDYYDSMSDYFRNTSRAIMAINQKEFPIWRFPPCC